MKFVTRILFLIFVTTVMLQACGNPSATTQKAEESEPAPWDLVNEGENPPEAEPMADLMADTAVTTALPDSAGQAMQAHADSANAAMPPALPPVRVRGVNNLEELFNDSNKYQYAAGERIGIKPIESVADAYFTRRPLRKISSGKNYTLAPLTHSVPYLVPEAAALLETIGRNFQDSLKSKKIGPHRLVVTSLLRTAHSVKSLRRVNINATDSSTHKLGTTFDIGYTSFINSANGQTVGDGRLKLVLAEVLRDLRIQNKCMVKYEIKTPCFHITATGL